MNPQKKKIFLVICIPASVVASFPLLVSLLWFELCQSSAVKCFSFIRCCICSITPPPPPRCRLRYRCGYRWLRGASYCCCNVGACIRCSLCSLSFIFKSAVGCWSLDALGLSLIFVHCNATYDGLCPFRRVYYSLYFFVASSIWDLLIVAFRCAILTWGVVLAH